MREMRRLEVILPYKVSTNDFYKAHFQRKAIMVSEFHEAIFGAIHEHKFKPVDEYPISLRMTFYLKGKMLDWVNLGAMAKACEDALRSNKILIDDSPKFIKHGTLIPKRSNKKYDYVEIEITKEEEGEGDAVEHL